MKRYRHLSNPKHTKTNEKKHFSIKDMLPVKELTIFTDGASRGNPGEAGAGAIIYGEQGALIKKITKYLGTTTNNVAEYMALIIALNEALALNGKIVHLFSDSELMVRQIKGIYKVRDRKMQALWREVKKLLAQFTQYDIICIDRRRNKEADKLANLVIDKQN